MRALRLAAICAFVLCSALAQAQQTTNVTASLVDPSGTVWANASWTATVISSLNPPVTFPGYNNFNGSWFGTADINGHFSVTVQAVAHIYPANATWQFCVVSGIAFTQSFCVNVPVGNTGQTTQDISTQINAVLTNPVVNGGFSIRAYNDLEVIGFPGAMYYNIISNTFRCYTTTWGPCSVGSGATTPATVLLLKGGGSMNSVLPALPGVDYVLPSGSISGTAGNLSGTPLLPNGTTAATQAPADVSGALATDFFVSRAISAITPITTPATTLLLKGSGIINQVITAVPGTDYLQPLANVNVLGSNSGGVLQAATSAQIVNALNTSPTTQLSSALLPFFAQPGDTIASIESRCSSACSYLVGIPQTFALSGNHTLSSNVNPVFLASGSWTVNGAFTLTIPTHVDGTLSQHFAGTATVKFGSSQALAPVEWFGAVGDGTTVDYTPIQATLNALSAGQALLQSKTYSLGTNTLAINKSSVGIKGTGMRVTFNPGYTNPNASVLLSTGASQDSVDVAGGSLTTNVGFNKFEDFDIERSAVPTGTASGLSLSYTYGVMVARVGIQDSIRNLYVHATGSQGNGFIEDAVFQWGYNGVTETSGNLYGIYVDSTDGNASPSFRVRHSFAAQNSLGATTFGVELIGSAINDQMFLGFETANMTFAEDVNQTALGGAGTSSDIHFNDTINDGCGFSCFRITGLTRTASAYVEINGGYDNTSSFNPVIDIESSEGVRVIGAQIGLYNGASAYSACVDINNSSSIAVIGILCQGAKNVGIVLTNSFENTITGNNLIGNADADGLITLTNSSVNAIVGNTLTGTGLSIVVDSNSNNNTGLYTNAITGLSALSNSGSNPLTAADAVSGTTYSLTTGGLWRSGAGAPSGACSNGSWYSNTATTTGTFPNYQCRNSVWAGLGTVY